MKNLNIDDLKIELILELFIIQKTIKSTQKINFFDHQMT